MISVNSNYVFNYDGVSGDAEDEIIENHYDDGRISDHVWDNYDWWSDLDGTVVSVISVVSVKKHGQCVDMAKVFIENKDFNWWFSAYASELSRTSGSNPAPASNICTCDLQAIMIRGCKCGGA